MNEDTTRPASTGSMSSGEAFFGRGGEYEGEFDDEGGSGAEGEEENVEESREWELLAEGDHGKEQILLKEAKQILEQLERLLAGTSKTSDGEGSLMQEGRGTLLQGVHAQLRSILSNKDTVVMLGASGTGKSSLTNVILQASLPSEASFRAAMKPRTMVGRTDPSVHKDYLKELSPFDPHATFEDIGERKTTVEVGDTGRVFYPCDGDNGWFKIRVLEVLDAKKGTVKVDMEHHEGEVVELTLGDGQNGSISYQPTYEIPTRPETERRFPTLGNFFLLKEGEGMDSTLVPVELEYGERPRLRFYYESESKVYDALTRLKKAILKFQNDTAGMGGSNQNGKRQALDDEIDYAALEGEDAPIAELEARGVRTAWMQEALAMAGYPPNERLSKVEVDKIGLPERFQGCPGKMKIFEPGLDWNHENPLRNAIDVMRKRLCTATTGGVNSKGPWNEPHWRVIRKVVVEMPCSALAMHRWRDPQGVARDAGAFNDQAQSLKDAKYVIWMVNGRRDQSVSVDKLRKDFIEPLINDTLLDAAEGGGSGKALAVVLHGEKGFPTDASTACCASLLADHHLHSEENIEVLREAESEVMDSYKQQLVEVMSQVLSARKGGEGAGVDLESEALAAQVVEKAVKFIVIYPRLLYEKQRYGSELGITEEESRLPELRAFLKTELVSKGQSGGNDDGSSVAEKGGHVAKVLRETLKTIADFNGQCEFVFEMGRLHLGAGCLGSSTIKAVNSIGLAGAKRFTKFNNKAWLERFMAEVRGELMESAQERARRCTPELFGYEIVRRMVDYKAGQVPSIVGQLPPYDFHKHASLYRKLLEPVNELMTKAVWGNVRLYELMCSPHFDWSEIPFPGTVSVKFCDSMEAIKAATAEDIGLMKELYDCIMSFYDFPPGMYTDDNVKMIIEGLRWNLRLSLHAILRKYLAGLSNLDFFGGIVTGLLHAHADEMVCKELLAFIIRQRYAKWVTASDRAANASRLGKTQERCQPIGERVGEKFVELAFGRIQNRAAKVLQACKDLVAEHHKRCAVFNSETVGALVGEGRLHRTLQDYIKAQEIEASLLRALARCGCHVGCIDADVEPRENAQDASLAEGGEPREWTFEEMKMLVEELARAKGSLDADDPHVLEVLQRLEALKFPGREFLYHGRDAGSTEPSTSGPSPEEEPTDERFNVAEMRRHVRALGAAFGTSTLEVALAFLRDPRNEHCGAGRDRMGANIAFGHGGEERKSKLLEAIKCEGYMIHTEICGVIQVTKSVQENEGIQATFNCAPFLGQITAGYNGETVVKSADSKGTANASVTPLYGIPSALRPTDVRLQPDFKFDVINLSSKFIGRKVRRIVTNDEGRKVPREGFVSSKKPGNSNLYMIKYEDNGETEEVARRTMDRMLLPESENVNPNAPGRMYGVRTQGEIEHLLKQLADFYGEEPQGVDAALEDYVGTALPPHYKMETIASNRGGGWRHVFKYNDPNPPNRTITFQTRLDMEKHIARLEAARLHTTTKKVLPVKNTHVATTAPAPLKADPKKRGRPPGSKSLGHKTGVKRQQPSSDQDLLRTPTTKRPNPFYAADGSSSPSVSSAGKEAPLASFYVDEGPRAVAAPRGRGMGAGPSIGRGLGRGGRGGRGGSRGGGEGGVDAELEPWGTGPAEGLVKPTGRPLEEGNRRLWLKARSLGWKASVKWRSNETHYDFVFSAPSYANIIDAQSWVQLGRDVHNFEQEYGPQPIAQDDFDH